MDYTSIHIYGHLLSDDILHNIERDNTLIGNRDQDFGMDISVSSAIDYVWSSLRNDWNFYKERAGNERLAGRDPYGTRRARDLMERLLQSLGYKLDRQVANIEVAGTGYDISYTCTDLGNMPFVIIGENITTDGSINTLDKCSLDYRAKGNMRKKSAHATMLDYAEFPNEYEVQKRPSSINGTLIGTLADSNSSITPWYWVKKSLIDERLTDKDRNGNVRWQWKHSYFIAFRDVTNATNERTCVATLMPSGVAAGDKAPLVFTSRSLIPSACFAAMLSSLVFDYVARQKVGGSSMALFIMKQQPVLTPDQIPSITQWQIVKRVAELCYFNHDMDGWAEELWEEMNEEQRAELPQLGAQQPWGYNPERRAVLQAELDAIFAHLYGLNTEDLRYILDPEDVCGKGCINETFRVLKDNELRQYGEYRTKRLVLDAWNKFKYDD